MYNIYRMHMYRVSKAVSTYVLLAVLFGTMFMSLGILFLIYDNPVSSALNISMSGAGLDVFHLFPATIHQYYVQSSNTYLILVSIFSVIFANCDFTRGFAKNTYSMFEKRRPLVFAKWLALVTCITASYIVYSFISLGITAVCISAFESAFWGEYFMGYFVVYLCLISLVTMVFWITTLFKSPAGGMVIGILISSGTFVLIEMMISGLLVQTLKVDFNLAEYFLDYAFMSYSADMGAGDTIRTIIVALVYMAFALTMSVFLSDRKDVHV